MESASEEHPGASDFWQEQLRAASQAGKDQARDYRRGQHVVMYAGGMRENHRNVLARVFTITKSKPSQGYVEGFWDDGGHWGLEDTVSLDGGAIERVATPEEVKLARQLMRGFYERRDWEARLTRAMSKPLVDDEQ